jgi:hypothetical protein
MGRPLICLSLVTLFSLYLSLVTRHSSLSQMLDLANVQCEQFAACLNQDFDVVFSDGTLVLQLSEARPLDGAHREATREPFSLVFRGPAQLRLPQGIYKMSNAQLGEMEIFLVQIAADQTSSAFEAVFN